MTEIKSIEVFSYGRPKFISNIRYRYSPWFTFLGSQGGLRSQTTKVQRPADRMILVRMKVQRKEGHGWVRNKVGHLGSLMDSRDDLIIARV